VTAFFVGNTTGESSSGTFNGASSISAAGLISAGYSGGDFLLSASTLTASAFDAVPGLGAAVSAAANTGTSGNASFWPFFLPEYVAAGFINFAQQWGLFTASNSTASSGAETLAFSYGLYSRMAGASSSRISAFTSGLMSVLVSQSSGSMTVSQPMTTATSGFSYATTSGNVTDPVWSSQYTGPKLIQVPVASVLTPGQYWVGLFAAISTSQVSEGLSFAQINASMNLSLVGMAPIGSVSSQFSNADSMSKGIAANWQIFEGLFSSAGQTNLPSSLALSELFQGVGVIGSNGPPVMRMFTTL
jgi:hypothetical protein